MENEKFFDFGDFWEDGGYKKYINIPIDILNLIEKKFNIIEAYKARESWNNLYIDNATDSTQDSYIILDDMEFYIKADEAETNYLRKRERLSPIEDLYYKYEGELKYVFPDPTYLEASLVSGDFVNMARLGGVPSWVISQVLEIYKRRPNNIELCISFSVTVDYKVLESIIKDKSVADMIYYLDSVDSYINFMEILKDNNVPLKMRISSYGYYEDDIDKDTLSLDTFNDSNTIIKDCGTLNNFHFDYEKMIDEIYNEIHK